MWKFVISSSERKNWIHGHPKEVCFIGRSNVGKSSLINAITGRNGLARTSVTPGRTQLINFFSEDEKMIVDLPGYGYAKMPPAVKKKMIAMIGEYFRERQELVKTFVLVDTKVGPTKDDVEMVQFLKEINRPFMIVMTKQDKAKQAEAVKSEKKVASLTEDYIIVSSFKGKNISKMKKIVDANLK